MKFCAEPGLEKTNSVYCESFDVAVGIGPEAGVDVTLSF